MRPTIHQGPAPEDIPSLEQAARRLIDVTSQRFVPPPSRKDVAADALIALKRFKNSCRWREFWVLKSENSGEDDASDVEQEGGNEDLGLDTGLRRVNVINKEAPRGSPRLESFLKDAERRILNELQHGRMPSVSNHSGMVSCFLGNLKGHSDKVAVPTDKTASYRVVSLDDYSSWMQQHLSRSAQEIPRSQLKHVFVQAQELATEFGEHLNGNEADFISQSLTTRAIPSPFLLIKDHQPCKPDGTYPTRLVVPAQNFTACFPKMGYLGLKKLFDRCNVTYGSRTIVNSQDLIKKLSPLNLLADNVTIMSLDIERLYPTVTFPLVHRAVWHYATRSGISRADRDIVRVCLQMIKFGMGHSLLTYQDKYYEYDGACRIDDKGLTIGGFESAWLADLVASFILDESASVFSGCAFYGIYRDDGLIVFRGQKTATQVDRWLRRFQARSDHVAGDGKLKFTAVLWSPNKQQDSPSPSLSVDSSPMFHYLDIDLFWSELGALGFKVGLKPNQVLSYLNDSSTHPKHVFRAVGKGAMTRLATTLTHIPGLSRYARLDAVYPDHAEALRKSGNAPTKFPRLLQHQKAIAAKPPDRNNSLVYRQLTWGSGKIGYRGIIIFVSWKFLQIIHKRPL